MSVDLVQILVAVDLLRRVLRILRGRGFELAPIESGLGAASTKASIELTRTEAELGLETIERELARGLPAEDRAAFVEVAAAFRAALQRGEGES